MSHLSGHNEPQAKFRLLQQVRRAVRTKGYSVRMSPRFTSRLEYFAKERMVRWPRYITEEFLSGICATSSRQRYLLEAILASVRCYFLRPEERRK